MAAITIASALSPIVDAYGVGREIVQTTVNAMDAAEKERDSGAWSQSSMLRHLKARNYVQACKSLLKWKYAAKRDCSIRSNNCYGVWTRQQARYDKCMGEN